MPDVGTGEWMALYKYLDVKEALNAYFSGRRGPRGGTPHYAPRSSTREYSTHDTSWLIVGAILHGPAPTGCGVEIGSEEENSVRRWAEGHDEQGWVALKAERILRDRLREECLIPPSTRQRLVTAEPTERPELQLHRLQDIVG